MQSWTLLSYYCTVLVACRESPERPVDAEAGVQVELSGPKVCALSGDRDALGSMERRDAPTPQMSDAWIWGGGITAADLNGDGWLDVLVALEQGLELYEGSESGQFPAVGMQVFGSMNLTFISGTSVADYDADGDLDIYVMRVMPGTTQSPDPVEPDGLGENRLLQNQGDGTFVDVTEEAGEVTACGPHHRTDYVGCYRTMASSWGDVDLDGDLDLYVGNYGYVDETEGTQQVDMEPAEPDFLYLNDGDGTFTNASALLPDEFQDGYTYVGGFYDFDNDGDLEVYTVNDFGTKYPNRVLWNEGGALVWDPSDLSGLVVSGTGMGLGIADFNDDGWLDLAIPEWNRNRLLMSEPDSGTRGIWVDEADSSGFVPDAERDQKVGWGTEVGDIDNDGDLDIVSQYGHVANDNPIWENPSLQPDALYLATLDGQGNYAFEDAAEDWGVADAGMTRGVVLADLNRDGWLDIGKRDLLGENMLYISRCGDEGWLTVHLRDPDSKNTYAIGAKVVVTVAGLTMTRTVVAGGTGYASSPPPELHFGVGMNDSVEAIRVIWPDGAENEIREIETRQQVTITR